MVCDVCSAPVSSRLHDGRRLCSVHKETSPVALVTVDQPHELDDIRYMIREAMSSISSLVSQVAIHETRISASESAFGSQESLLGDFFSKADGETQARVLVAEINKIKARIDTSNARQFILEVAQQQNEGAHLSNDRHIKEVNQKVHDFVSMTWRGRLAWLFGRSG